MGGGDKGERADGSRDGGGETVVERRRRRDNVSTESHRRCDRFHVDGGRNLTQPSVSPCPALPCPALPAYPACLLPALHNT